MKYFAVLFLGVITFSHLYLFWNLWWIFYCSIGQLLLPAFLCVAFIVLLFRRGIFASRFRSSLIGAVYLWLGFLFVASLFFLARDAAELIAFLLDRMAATQLRPYFLGSESYATALVLGFLGFLYSLYEAAAIRVVCVSLQTDRFSYGMRCIRVAVLTDLHLTDGTSITTINRVVNLVNAQKPDIIVVVGDVVDGYLSPDGKVAAALRGLNATAGKFAVLGNHDVYNGIIHSCAFIEGAGFILLRGSVVAAGGICVVGVDDPQVGERIGITEALAGVDPHKFVLLLSHRPEVPPAAVGNFDLEVAGHTHGGQIWPGGIAARIFEGFSQGLTQLPSLAGKPCSQSYVYVSNGTLYWGPPIRLFTPPEITIIDIANAE